MKKSFLALCFACALAAPTLYTSTIFVNRRYYAMDHNPPRYPVTCEIDGKAHRGIYWIAGKGWLDASRDPGNATAPGAG